MSESQTAAQKLNRELGVQQRAFHCPSCGASLVIDPNHMATFCSFCGSHLPDADKIIEMTYDYIKHEDAKEAELKRLKLEQARMEEQHKLEIERLKNERIRDSERHKAEMERINSHKKMDGETRVKLIVLLVFLIPLMYIFLKVWSR
jgi:uncharacterized Zn finger protein (UPF0148 family)